MSKRFEVLSSQQALGMLWRRPLKVAAALISPGSDLGDPSISLVPDVVNIKEGDWVETDANGDAVLSAGPARRAFPVYTGGGRFDVRAGGQISVLWGLWIARTAAVKPGIVVAGAGVPLTTDAGLLRPAVAGEGVVAISEGPLLPGDGQFPDGFLEISSLVGGLA